jgi:hypothetical protein
MTTLVVLEDALVESAFGVFFAASVIGVCLIGKTASRYLKRPYLT